MIKIDFTESDKKELEYERFHYPVPRIQLKFEALYLKSHNLSHELICEICDISKVTLVKYFKQYIEGGIERLKLNLHKGKENSLSAHAETLEKCLSDKPIRSTKEAQKIIEEKTGIKRCPTQVREFLKKLGFTYRKVGYVPGNMSGEKIEEQENFKKDVLEPAIAEAEQGKKAIFFWTPPTSCSNHI